MLGIYFELPLKTVRKCVYKFVFGSKRMLRRETVISMDGNKQIVYNVQSLIHLEMPVVLKMAISL
jgi:hypothetical protein